MTGRKIKSRKWGRNVQGKDKVTKARRRKVWDGGFNGQKKGRIL